MAKSRETVELVKEFSRGLIGTALDTTLFLFCFGSGWALSGMGSYKGKVTLGPLVYMMEIYPELRLKLRNAFHLARRDGYLEKDNNSLTQAGIQRLTRLLPRLKRQPVWSGSLWLLTYDIVENRKKDRDRLRKFLLSQGYGRLQHSVYVALFDPTELVRDAITDFGLKGEVLISRMGTDGHIGEMSTQELIKKIYRLEPISFQYQHFIGQSIPTSFSADEAALTFLYYLSILKKDPQLPSELLPEDWPGEKAYQLIVKNILPALTANSLAAEKVLESLNFVPWLESPAYPRPDFDRGSDYWTGE